MQRHELLHLLQHVLLHHLACLDGEALLLLLRCLQRPRLRRRRLLLLLHGRQLDERRGPVLHQLVVELPGGEGGGGGHAYATCRGRLAPGCARALT